MKTRAQQKKEKLRDKNKSNMKKKKSNQKKNNNQESKQAQQKLLIKKSTKEDVEKKIHQIKSPKLKRKELGKEPSLEKKVKKAINNQKSANFNEQTTPKNKNNKKSQKLIKKSAKGAQKINQSQKQEQLKQIEVDSQCEIKNDVHVYQTNQVYDINLCQFNKNYNKFFKIQLLESNDFSKYYIWNRWGVCGQVGSSVLKGPMQLEQAKQDYSKKFLEKTSQFQYKVLEIIPSEIEQSQQQIQQPNTMPQQLEDLISLIFDKKLLNQQLKEYGYDTNQSLQQLEEKNITKGYQILTKLSESIKQKKPEYLLKQYSQDFYSFIPHTIGSPTSLRYVIDCEKKVQNKVEMLQSLIQIKSAVEQIDSPKELNNNNLEDYYKKLNCSLTPLKKSENEFKIIETYLENTHGPTHTSCVLEILDIFKIERENEEEAFRKDIKRNKLLLWYGTKVANYAGLLKNGFKIPSIEAPPNIYDFGKGIYFSDMVTKSAIQCSADKTHNIGLLMLCEVACGPFNEKFYADYKGNQLPEGKLAIKACGKFQPEASDTELNGFTVPLGKPETVSVLGALQYNEYVVYDVNQIKMKYLVKCKFNYKFGNQYF